MALPILDISEFQENVTYSVACKYISGAILRVGYTGIGSAHGCYEDECFCEHYNGFNGKVPLGGYWYACAVDDDGVKAEVAKFKEAAAGCTFSLPVFYDIETTRGDYAKLTCAERTRLAVLWCKLMKEAGYAPGIYTYLNYVESGKLTMSQFDDLPVWMAQYNSELEYNGRANYWQYTSEGTIPGINGNVDLSKVVEEPATVENATATGTIDDTTAMAYLRSVIGDPFDKDVAIRALQKVIGTDVDGIIGPKTKAAIKNVTTGSTGEEVKVLQACLGIGITGTFGAITLAAVKKVQKEHGLDVDGIAGKDTFTAILS